jgi:hypothetical protein
MEVTASIDGSSCYGCRAQCSFNTVQSPLRLADKDALVALYHATSASQPWRQSAGWEKLIHGSTAAEADVACVDGELHGVTCSHLGEGK